MVLRCVAVSSDVDEEADAGAGVTVGFGVRFVK
jgi:hypothetical protein